MTNGFGIFTSFCFGCSVLSAALNPNLYPFVLGGWGSAMGGAAFVSELRRKKEAETVEATRVATVFNSLYEQNRGLISPNQLSVLTGVPLNKTDAFLKAFCENQNGKYIKSSEGNVYNFSHPNNVLDQLTSNAQAWAKSQTEPLLQEISNLKTEVIQLRSYINRPPVIPQQTTLNNSEEQPDPWNKLL